MYKIVIADDEHLALELIKRLIHWEQLGLELAGYAEEGHSALNLIAEKKPEIVITDIRMPGLDGLEIVRRTRDKGIRTNFIIISGHKQFDYAYHAIKYGVEDYLLKPINEKELNEVLKKICKNIAKDADQEQTLKEIESKLQSSVGLIKQNSLIDLLNGQEVAAAIMSEWGPAAEGRMLQFLAVKIDKREFDEDIPSERMDMVLDRIGDGIIRLLSENDINADKFIIDNILYCLVPFDGTLRKEIQKKYKVLFSEMETVAERYQLLTLTFGLGAAIENPADLGIAIRSAREAIYRRIDMGAGRIIRLEDFEEEIYRPEINLNGSELESIMDLADEAQLHAWMNRALGEIRSKLVSAGGRLEAYGKMLRSALSRLQENAENKEEAIEEAVRNLYGLPRKDKIEQYIRAAILESFRGYQDRKKKQMTRPIRDAKKYINDHYDEDLSLESIASMVYLSPVYFSVLFKNEEGVNFSKYVTNFRMNKAKDLLKETNDPVSQVAQKTGYKDQKHFSKLFKKTFGITPNEYRKMHA